MLSYPQFEVETKRTLTTIGLGWPSPSEASNEANLGCNRAYVDLRGLDWADAERVFELEASLIERLENSHDPEDEYVQIEDELYEDDEGLFGLDIGVAATVAALSASGCIPCSSCNAGAYGGTHHEAYPVVAFFAMPYHVNLLLECAEEAAIGLECAEGLVAAFASDIRNMRKFSSALIRRQASCES